ncbi:MAG: type II toxin-antitoxin system RatA family toxin [Pseudomonadota bacterium]
MSTKIHKTAIVPYTDQAMFDLVRDIDRYAEFLPWCSQAAVLQETAHDVIGQIEIHHLGFRQAFSTRNVLNPPHHMSLELQEGPFKTFHGDWQFERLNDEACKVSLTLQFAFANFVMQSAFGSIFEQIANTLVDSFCQRARDIYGSG